MRKHIINIHSSDGTAYDIHLSISDAGLSDKEFNQYIDAFLGQNIKNIGSWSLHDISTHRKPSLQNIEDYIAVMHFWAYGEYKNHPLCFVGIGNPTPEQVIRILRQYDEWYGNTDQNTEDYALEYQILARMLLCDNKLLVNPKYLDAAEPEVVSWLDNMLLEISTPTTQDGFTAYALARRLTQAEIDSLYSSCKQNRKSGSADEKQFFYCGHHFHPLLQLDKQKVNINRLIKLLYSDQELGMSTYAWRRLPYNYHEFYEAANIVGARNIDLFLCIENGKTYIPGENELFLIPDPSQIQ